MKQVLLIDGSPFFREYLKEKLEAEQISVDTANGKRDAFTKLITTLPNLIIIEIDENSDGLDEFLNKKKIDPNARSIPIIISGPKIDHKKALQLVQYEVIKYFTKPIRFDAFFDSVGKVLKQVFSMDRTPCVLDVHNNNNIIFAEISKGLNREKISILKYKIKDIIEANSIRDPKVVIMISGMTLTFVDGINLELLFNNIISDVKLSPKNVKVLTQDQFTKDLIQGHSEYHGMEVVNNLGDVMNSLIDTGPIEDVPEVLSTRILDSNGTAENGDLETRFTSDLGKKSEEGSTERMKVAVVDDDVIIRDILYSAFAAKKVEVTTYATAIEFLKAVKSQNFDVVILDIYIPDMSGFDVLKTLQKNDYNSPIIIYSQATQKEVVVQTLSLGAKSYLVKPQNPEVLVAKALSLVQ